MIHFVSTGSGTALEKDGRTYGSSGLFNDPIEAVSGDPDAEGHARKYVSRTRTAGVLGLLGFAGFTVGIAVATSEPVHTDRKVIGGGLAIASAVTAMVGLLLLPSARHHLLDAINIYNDNVYSRRSERDASVKVGYPPSTTGQTLIRKPQNESCE